MSQNNIGTDSEQLSQVVMAGMQEKKAKDIVVMDLRGLEGASSDFLVVSTGTSPTHVRSIKESIQKAVFKATQSHCKNIEGAEEGEWVLLDYFNVVAHVFQQEKRDFYGLEALWGDAKITRIEDKD
jgi:ribosome-associated protein